MGYERSSIDDGAADNTFISLLWLLKDKIIPVFTLNPEYQATVINKPKKHIDNSFELFKIFLLEKIRNSNELSICFFGLLMTVAWYSGFKVNTENFSP